MVEDGVVSLGRPARPDDLSRAAPQPGGELLPGRGQRGVGPRPDPVWAGGIADLPLDRFQPCGSRRRGDRMSGVMIEVEH